MHPDLEGAWSLIQGTASDLTVEQLTRKPEGKWCAAEILEHLTLAFSGTARFLEQMEKSGKVPALRPTLGELLRRWVVVDAGYFPPGRQAPEIVRPRGAAPEQALENIGKALREMDEVLARCEERFGSRRLLLNHPVLGPFSVRHWRRFHYVHTRHHMKQIARLRDQAMPAVGAAAGSHSS